MNRLVQNYPVAAFFVLTFLITGGSTFLFRLMVEGVIPRTNAIPAVAPFGPSITGVILTLYLYGGAGLRELLSRVRPWSTGWVWPLICLTLPLAVLLTAVAIRATYVGGELPHMNRFTWPNYFVAAMTTAILGAGLTEEFGWRGFALPHLQRNHNALFSALLIGLVWALWHFPHGFILGHAPDKLVLLSYIPGTIAMSVGYTVVFKNTNGSVLAVMLLHGANNASWRFVKDDLFPGLDMGGEVAENLLVGMIWILVATFLTLAFGPGNLARQERQIVHCGAHPEDISEPETKGSHQASPYNFGAASSYVTFISGVIAVSRMFFNQQPMPGLQ